MHVPVPGRDLCIQVSGLFFCKMSNIAEKRSWKELDLVDDGQKSCVKLKSFWLGKRNTRERSLCYGPNSKAIVICMLFVHPEILKTRKETRCESYFIVRIIILVNNNFLLFRYRSNDKHVLLAK